MQGLVRTATPVSPDVAPGKPDTKPAKLLFFIGFWHGKSVLNLLEGLEDFRRVGKEALQDPKCPAFLAPKWPKTLKSPAVAEMASHLESAAVVFDHDRRMEGWTPWF